MPGFAATQTNVQKENRSSDSSGTFSRSSSSGRVSSGSVVVETADGQAKVLWKGQPVFTGPVKSAVTARSGKDEGKEIGAVFEGERLLWESQAGAAKKLGTRGASATASGSAGGTATSGGTSSSGGKAGGSNSSGGVSRGSGTSGGTSGGTNTSKGTASGGRVVVPPTPPLPKQ
jgi:hypothetical protein